MASSPSPHQPARSRALQLDALQLLQAFAADLVSIHEPEPLLWAIAERTISQLGWEDCVIYLYDAERDVLIQKAAYGPKSIDYRAIFQPLEIPMGKGIVGQVAQNQKALRIDDTRACADYILDDEERLSELCVPMMIGDKLIGVIDSEHPSPNFYTAADEMVLQTIAHIAATKVEMAFQMEANARLAMFYKRNPNPVIRIAPDQKILFINEAAERWFEGEFRKGDGLVADRLTDALDMARSEGKARWQMQKAAPPDGSKRTGEFSIVHLPSGGFNLYGTDITHIVELQHAAESANAAKSRFLSVMSHEIRTPLNALLGLTDLLIRENPDRQEQLKHLAYMEFSGRHLLSLVNDILDLEKLASGKATTLQSSFNLHELVHTIVEGFRNRAEQVGLSLHLELASNLPVQVVSDVKWLTQILNNLISNAIKYTQEGQVIMTASKSLDTLGTEGLRFAVKDTGRGIPRDEIQRILRPFEQIRTDPTIEGTGLGLAIVSSLVHRMQGTLRIQSEPGTGSTFTVDIPLSTDDAEARLESEQGSKDSDVPSTPSALTEEKKPILLVDDNELNRFVACKLLGRWNFEVVEAEDGVEALEKWPAMAPCIILMDIQMPRMDGIEATRQIRVLEKESALTRSPIIALTADAEEKTLMRLLGVGMDDRVIKPFDPPALRAILDEATLQLSAAKQ